VSLCFVNVVIYFSLFLFHVGDPLHVLITFSDLENRERVLLREHGVHNHLGIGMLTTGLV